MTDELRMSRALADEMIRHLESERPNEGCGLIAGEGGTATKIIKMTNMASSPLRYALVPLEFQRAQDLIDEEGIRLLGGFHSHTRTEAFPSPTDVKEAYGDFVHVIVSLAEETPVVRAFRIPKEHPQDKGEIVEVPVVVDG